MAIKERKQITGTTEQINAYAGHEGQIVWDKEKKTFVGMSGTAGKNYPLASKEYVDNKTSPLASKEYVDGGLAGKVTSDVLVGMVAMFSRRTPPDGWLLCNGAAVSRKTYADLYAVIGDTYGSGDGSTTFNLPNLDYRFLEGTTSSYEVGEMVEAGLPNITGGAGGIVWNGNSSGALLPGIVERSYINSNILDNGSETLSRIVFSANSSNKIYGNSSTVQPASIRLLPCIKY